MRSRDEGTKGRRDVAVKDLGTKERRDEGNPSRQSAIDAQSAIDNRQSTIQAVWAALATVTDPEIPVLNIVEMGIVAGVRDSAEGVAIDLTPTFVGCPALEVIRDQVHGAVAAALGRKVTVRFVFDPPWTSDRITDEGRQKLLAFGLAPPRQGSDLVSAGLPSDGDDAAGSVAAGLPRPEATLERVPCPHCGSTDTVLDSPFGPTLCRSIHYCHSCRQSFEHFKPL